MYPFALQFDIAGSHLAIGEYTLFFGLAVIAGITGSAIFAAKRGFPVKKILLILAGMCVTAVIGARVLNALINVDLYAANPGRLFQFTATGFSLYGGIAAAVITGYLLCRALRINPFRLGDAIIPFLGISIATMRIGCFLNGCCFGQETDLPWGVTFPMASPAHLHQIGLHGNLLDVRPVHPTQLYELAAAALLSILAFSMLNKKNTDTKIPGRIMAVFLIFFSLFRLLNSFLRVSPDMMTASPYFYPAIYLLLALGGTLFLLKARYFAKKMAPPLTQNA